MQQIIMANRNAELGFSRLLEKLGHNCLFKTYPFLWRALTNHYHSGDNQVYTFDKLRYIDKQKKVTFGNSSFFAMCEHLGREPSLDIDFAQDYYDSDTYQGISAIFADLKQIFGNLNFSREFAPKALLLKAPDGQVLCKIPKFHDLPAIKELMTLALAQYQKQTVDIAF